MESFIDLIYLYCNNIYNCISSVRILYCLQFPIYPHLGPLRHIRLELVIHANFPQLVNLISSIRRSHSRMIKTWSHCKTMSMPKSVLNECLMPWMLECILSILANWYNETNARLWGQTFVSYRSVSPGWAESLLLFSYACMSRAVVFTHLDIQNKVDYKGTVGLETVTSCSYLKDCLQDLEYYVRLYE